MWGGGQWENEVLLTSPSRPLYTKPGVLFPLVSSGSPRCRRQDVFRDRTALGSQIQDILKVERSHYRASVICFLMIILEQSQAGLRL